MGAWRTALEQIAKSGPEQGKRFGMPVGLVRNMARDALAGPDPEADGLALARAVEDLAYACECNELLELGDVRRDVERLAVLARAYLAAHEGSHDG